MILREGDPGCSLYLIASGSVQVSTMAEGERVVLAELNPGACFGEVSLLSGGPRTATVMVTSPCRVLRLEQATVEAELQDDPKLRQRLTSMVQGRARDTIEKII